MPKKKIQPAPGFQLPPEILDQDHEAKSVESLKPGDYGWVTVLADSERRAFIPLGTAVRLNQDASHSPHFITRKEDGTLYARLMCQRVKQVELGPGAGVWPIAGVEI